MSIQPTPETDATRRDVMAGKWSLTEPGGLLEKLETLERQRDEALAQLAQARADDDRNNQLMVDLMRQRDELLAALEKQACLTAYYNGHSDGYKPHPNGGVFWENYLCLEARAAIAAVKGGK